MVKLPPAEFTGEAGGAVNTHDRLSDPETFHALSPFCNNTGIFMTKRSRHGNERMAAQICLEIGAAGKSGFHLYQQFALARERTLNTADLNAARFFQNSRTHGSDFQLAASDLAQNSSEDKKGDIPIINSVMEPRDENGRDREMNTEKPLQ